MPELCGGPGSGSRESNGLGLLLVQEGHTGSPVLSVDSTEAHTVHTGRSSPSLSPGDRVSEMVGWLHPAARMSGTPTRSQSLFLPQKGDMDGLWGWTVSRLCAISMCDLRDKNNYRRTLRRELDVTESQRTHGKMP